MEGVAKQPAPGVHPVCTQRSLPGGPYIREGSAPCWLSREAMPTAGSFRLFPQSSALKAQDPAGWVGSGPLPQAGPGRN